MYELSAYPQAGEPFFATEYAGFVSAMTGLGGLVALYDPTGCLGTAVNCWYAKPGGLFGASLFAAENARPDEDGLIRRIAAAAWERQPEFICLLDTPAGGLLGDNIQSAALEVQYAAGIPCYGVETSGMKYYNQGQKLAYDLMFQRLMDARTEQQKKTVNILGMTRLDFESGNEYLYLKYFVEDCGYTVNCRIGGGASPEEMKRAPGAELNLVLSAAAVPLAQRMKLELGIPYVPASIHGNSNRVRIAEFLGQDTYAPEEVCPRERKVLIVGEQGAANALRGELRDIQGYDRVDAATFFEFRRDMSEPGDTALAGIGALERLLSERNYDIVYADPTFREVCGKIPEFHAMPHPAVSDELAWLDEADVLC